jgi:hypothetical protein
MSTLNDHSALMTKVLPSRRTAQRPVRPIIILLIGAWLIVMQPGMSAYWLISSAVHAEIDADLYGQSPTGETLPGHAPHAPHDHPRNVGIPIADFTLTNVFGAAFYTSLLWPAQRPALHPLNDTAVIVHSITIESPDQPPRA